MDAAVQNVHLSRPTVFVIEDEDHVRELLSRVLSEAGYRTVGFPSAEGFVAQGLEKLPRPVCVVSDIRLRGLSGVNLLENMRAQSIHVPVILVSGYGSISLAVYAIRAGAYDFLEKPVSPRDLIQRVEECLNEDAARYAEEQHQSLAAQALSRLTVREREVYELLMQGKTDKQIAADSAVCVQTVAKQRARILSKLELSTVRELHAFHARVHAPPRKPRLDLAAHEDLFAAPARLR